MVEKHNLAKTRRNVQRRNHPAKGSSIKVEPIRDLRAITMIKKTLSNKPRNLCLFTLGINTAYRASELVSLRVGDVAHLNIGDNLDIKQGKNKKYRNATLNEAAYNAIQNWLAVHPRPEISAPLFISQRGNTISVPYVWQLVKTWCALAGLKGNYGSHTLRKTWGYHQRVQRGTPVALLMHAFGHASEKQTLDYLCIQPEELKPLYLEMEL